MDPQLTEHSGWTRRHGSSIERVEAGRVISGLKHNNIDFKTQNNLLKNKTYNNLLLIKKKKNFETKTKNRED